MEKRSIKFNIYGDIPNDVVWIVASELPKRGINVWTTKIGHVAVSKRDYVKSDIYDVYITHQFDDEEKD